MPSFVVVYGGPNTEDDFTDCFDKFRVVLLKKRISSQDVKCFKWQQTAGLFARLNTEDQSTWCVETPGQRETEVSPETFLDPRSSDLRGYCSFLVQNDATAYEDTLASLPVSDPLPGLSWSYASKALWFFFGRNPTGSLTLSGRPEHTDSIATDGTWHYQSSGSKTWFIRPTPQLLKYWKDEKLDTSYDSSTRLRVDCEEGDIVVINTRLWKHCTIILPQDVPSVSFARDFYTDTSSEQAVMNDSTMPATLEGTMKNLDGLYATDDIDAGTVIFTENDLPECHIPSAINPNCEVVELEDGTSALVSMKHIAQGQFFCVAESESDESEQE